MKNDEKIMWVDLLQCPKTNWYSFKQSSQFKLSDRKGVVFSPAVAWLLADISGSGDR